MNHSPSQRPPSFHWQAALILLPVILLAVLGLLSLRQDRLLAEQDARERAAGLVQRVATVVGEAATREIGAFLEATDEWLQAQYALAGVPGITNGASSPQRPGSWAANQPGFNLATLALPEATFSDLGVLRSPVDFPSPPQPPAWLVRLSEEQLVAWQTVRRGGDDARSVEAAWATLRQSAMPVEAGRSLDLEALQASQRTNPPSDQATRLEKFLDGLSPHDLTDTGLPQWDVVALQRIRMASTNGWPAVIARDLVSHVRDHPSMLTGALLDAAAPTAGEDQKQRADALRRLWQGDETVRPLARQVRDLRETAAADDEPTWVSHHGTNWLAFVVSAPDPGTNRSAGVVKTASRRAAVVRFVPESVIVTAILEAAKPGGYEVPPFSFLAAELGGRRFPISGQRPTAGSEVRLLAEALGSIAVKGGRGPFRIVSQLDNPDLLYARQRQRVQIFGTLIGASALAAMLGLFAAWRAFRRQLHLAEMKSNFVSSVSHELRAPIASVRLLAEGLQRGAVQGEARQQEYHGLIVRECRRLSALIENVLDFSRIEQGRKQYELEPTDVSRLVQETVKLVEPVARERDVELRLLPDAGCRMPDGSPLTAVWDGRAIQQALLNLLDNALKHAPADSTITVDVATNPRGTLNSQPSTLTLSVRDTGPGIPREDHARIFERFYRRGSELRRETQGVGLGLAIVKHIAEAHGGQVRVESEPGMGATFVLELPLATKPQTSSSQAPEKDQ